MKGYITISIEEYNKLLDMHIGREELPEKIEVKKFAKEKAISMIQTLKRDCAYSYIARSISTQVWHDLEKRLDEIIKELEG